MNKEQAEKELKSNSHIVNRKIKHKINKKEDIIVGTSIEEKMVYIGLIAC